jgi:hypothetical protein
LRQARPDRQRLIKGSEAGVLRSGKLKKHSSAAYTAERLLSLNICFIANVFGQQNLSVKFSWKMTEKQNKLCTEGHFIVRMKNINLEIYDVLGTFYCAENFVKFDELTTSKKKVKKMA